MRKRYRRALCLLAAAVLAAGAFQGVQASGELDGQQDRIDAIEEEQERLRDTLSELDSLKDDADAYLEAVNGELEGVQADITRLSRQMEETKAAIAQAETELAGAKESEKTQYENMKLRIKYMYEKGDTFFLELLFESASLSEFLSQAEYISKISEYDRNMLTAYQETKQLIADKTEELSEAYASLETTVAQAQAKVESLNELQAAKQQELESLNMQIAENSDLLADYDAALADELAEFQAIEEAIRRREEAAAAGSQTAAPETRPEASEPEDTEPVTEAPAGTEAPGGEPSETGGTETVPIETDPPETEPPETDPPETEPPASSTGFIWPVPSCSRISSGYGDRDDPLTGEADGTLSDHHGIDIALPGGALAGADIVAAADGEVVIARTSTSAGNWIVLYHGNSTYTVYMHCQRLLVSEGETVSQGETIGLVGSTGWSTGAHLHFEVRVGGFSTSAYSRNPLNYVSPP